MSIDFAAVLNAIRPGAEWSLDANSYEGLDWLDASEKPSLAELEAAWPSVQDATEWRLVRVERDRLLAASDWTQVADAPVDAGAWAVYRQKLRDIPQDFDSPHDVIWPAAP